MKGAFESFRDDRERREQDYRTQGEGARIWGAKGVSLRVFGIQGYRRQDGDEDLRD